MQIGIALNWAYMVSSRKNVPKCEAAAPPATFKENRIMSGECNSLYTQNTPQ